MRRNFCQACSFAQFGVRTRRPIVHTCGGIKNFSRFESMEMIIKETSDGRWLAWPKDREDIIASGETKDEVTANLKELYTAVIEYEASNPE